MAIDTIPNFIAPKIGDGITSLIAPATTFLSGGLFAPRSQAMDQNLQDIIRDQIARTGKTSGVIGYSDFDKSQAPGTVFPDAGAMAKNFLTGKMSPSEFANATTLGRLTYDVDPKTGKVTFGSNVYDFAPENVARNPSDDLGQQVFSYFARKANERAREINPNITIPVDEVRGFARDFSDFDKARMGGLNTLRGDNLFSKVDARTADEEAALLDDAFEQQLALATRTGKLGPFEGIIQNLNPKDAVSFITSLLTGGASTALQGVASFADRLGIRRGMQEPPGAEGTGGYGVSRPGNTLTDQTRANRAEFSDFYSGFQGGAQQQMGKRVDDVINRTVSGRRTRSDAADFVSKYGSKEQKSRFEGIQKDKENVKQNPYDTTEGQGGGGSSKIVCTMMNKSYGFGSFRNKIWMNFHKNLSPEYQKGYHKIFLPLVKIAKKNKIVKKILEHIAVHSTIDMRQSMRGKKHLLGRLYRKIILPICYWAGKK